MSASLRSAFPEALQYMQGGAIVLGCELHQGICMNILAHLTRLLMCCKELAGCRSLLQRSNYHYYRHITQGSLIHTFRFCSGTWTVEWWFETGRGAEARQVAAG